MSFRIHPHYRIMIRKEKDSLLKKIKTKMNDLKRERTSSFTSKGSITVEAAVVIPVYFMVILCMVYIFEVFGTQVSIRNGLQNVGKELAQEVYGSTFLTTEDLEAKLIETVGRERLEDSIIAGGSKGVSCAYSNVNLFTGEMNLNVRYQVEIPVLFFRLPVRTFEERLKVKIWNGYKNGAGISDEYEMVYVTDTGTVYHKNLSCTYLELSIRSITKNEIAYVKNEAGDCYEPCSRCKNLEAGLTVYITDYGSRYHTSLNCPGLKRTVSMVPLYTLNGLGGCSKCVY